jgi:anti-sigma regulatory factor (Ser/Thr protein kinase)
VNEETLEISLVNDLKEVARTAEQIDEFCASQDIASEVAYAINLALDEILTNTISYGYADDVPHQIEISIHPEAEALVIVIVDDSAAFDLSNAPTPDVGASLEERPLGGLGLFLVHQMMDSVEYRREEGRNVVTLKKNKTTEQSPDEG